MIEMVSNGLAVMEVGDGFSFFLLVMLLMSIIWMCTLRMWGLIIYFAGDYSINAGIPQTLWVSFYVRWAWRGSIRKEQLWEYVWSYFSLLLKYIPFFDIWILILFFRAGILWSKFINTHWLLSEGQAFLGPCHSLSLFRYNFFF